MAITYLADKSALARLRHTAVATRLTPLLLGGEVATCGVIELELLYSARSHSDLQTIRTNHHSLPRLDTLEADFERAADVIELLSRTGHHRAVTIPDLLIAAVAERHRVCVLHYDRDFEVIAKATKQAVDWVVPAGSVP